MEKLKKREGFSTIEFIIAAVLMTFVMFFPIAAMLEMHTINVMEQELNRALQMAAVQGGLTSNVQQAVEDNLAQRGIGEVSFTPDSTFSPVERGSIITVGIEAERPHRSLFSGVTGLVGGRDLESETYTVKGKIMSEFIQ